jgi:hypothetical protein
LVDLARSQVVDLLPTRSADSLGEWLAEHPEITTVSRDRQGVYAEGARRVAPEAVQVADRFHLVLNLTQAVERELAVNRRQLRIASPSAPVLPPSPTTEEVKSRSEPIRVRSSVMMHQMEVARQRRQQKLELFRTIKQMRGAGMKVNQIARQLGLCRRRIDKWIQFDELPERSRMQPRPGMHTLCTATTVNRPPGFYRSRFKYSPTALTGVALVQRVPPVPSMSCLRSASLLNHSTCYEIDWPICVVFCASTSEFRLKGQVDSLVRRRTALRQCDW